MPYAYIPAIINEDWCLGNSLSTINMDFTALDFALSSLSAYTVRSINFLSATMIAVSASLYTMINTASGYLQTEINYLSSTMQSTSAFLQTEINYLSAQSPINYFAQRTIYQLPDGVINWNVSATGLNAKVILSANGFISNIEGIVAGQEGNLVMQSNGVTGYQISGYGNAWMFANNISGFTIATSAYNMIHFYYDGAKLLSKMNNY